MSRRERIAQERAAAARQSGSAAGDTGAAAPGAPAPLAATGPRPIIKSAPRNPERSAGPPATASGAAGHAAGDPYGGYGAYAQPRTEPMTQPVPTAPGGPDFDAIIHGGSQAGAYPAAAAAAEPDPGRGSGGGSKAHRTRRERQPLGPVRGTIRAFGELCITAGLVLILFVVWQLWWTDIEANQDNENLAHELTTQWKDNPRNKTPKDPKTPVVAEPADINSAFGIMYIPRFGDDYYRTIAEGVSLEPVLNRMGLGRYPNAAMPGEVGNFAMAGHRVTYGKPLNLIAELRPGDQAVVQTADGFYTYTFVNFDIVLPDQTDVLAPVPDMPEYKGKDRIMTLTACNPMFSARERYVGYFELSDWRHASEGPPENIKDSGAYQKAGAKN